MRVDRLINLLGKMKPSAVVKALDADEGKFVPVTGVVFGDTDVELQTDDCGHPACWGPCGTCGAHVHENDVGRFCPNCGAV